MDLSNFSLIFMGTPAFAASVLAFLIEKKYPIAAVYTQPPKPKDRGYDLSPSPVHLLALEHGLTIYTPASLKSLEIQEQFRELVKINNVKACIVVAYGLILPKHLLDAPLFGCLNVHASVLPRWRGASPIQRAIEAGDTQTGLTLMKMDEGLDTGPILLEKRVPISSKDITTTLLHKFSLLAGPLVMEGLLGLSQKTLSFSPQSQEGVTYAPKVLKEEGLLNFDNSAFSLEQKVRAFNPWPGTFFNFKDIKIKVLEASAENSTYEGQPGEIIDLYPLKILCKDKTVFLPFKLQRPGGKPLMTDEFLRGFPLKKGMFIESASLCPVIK